MNTAIPQYNEIRITLTDIESLICEYIAGPEVVDIGETIRVMLGEYFYGEPPVPLTDYHTDQDRTVALRPGARDRLNDAELAAAIELIGEIFWAMADSISNRVLQVSESYFHRPNECFYKFFAPTRELVVYTPVIPQMPRIGLAAMDGRAVITACSDTLPSFIRSAL